MRHPKEARSSNLLTSDLQTTPLGSRIPLTSLLQALAVAEFMSFRNAALSLGVTQSSVSTRIRVLEEELGILLFERHPRGVRLTDVGRTFLERIAVGVGELDHAVKTARMTARGDCGFLRIGAPALIPQSFLAELLQRYRSEHPAIDVQIAEGTARDTVRQLRSNDLDVAFVAGPQKMPDCHSKKIWSEALVVALPIDHPLGQMTNLCWADLNEETFLVRCEGTGPQICDHIVARLNDGQKMPLIKTAQVSRETLIFMVSQNMGITIVGRSTARIGMPGVVFRDIADEPDAVVFSAVWSPQNRNPALRRLIELAVRVSRSAASG